MPQGRLLPRLVPADGRHAPNPFSSQNVNMIRARIQHHHRVYRHPKERSSMVKGTILGPILAAALAMMLTGSGVIAAIAFFAACALAAAAVAATLRRRP